MFGDQRKTIWFLDIVFSNETKILICTIGVPSLQPKENQNRVWILEQVLFLDPLVINL